MNNNTIFQYINSIDIREYLKNIDYNFNPLEAAWLIYQCDNITIAEKHAAWTDLIESMPDCSIPDRYECIGRDSLHEFLREYINVENECIRRFKDSTGAIYSCYKYYKDDENWSGYWSSFSSLQKCLDSIDKSLLDKVAFIRVRKEFIDKSDSCVEIDFNTDFNIMAIYDSTLSESERDVIDESFDGMWFEFPVPFEKGDIVVQKSNRCSLGYDKSDIFVLTDLAAWGVNDFTRANGGTHDMNAWGHYIYDNGILYTEHTTSNYMSLIRCPQPLTGRNRILNAVSTFIKGEAPLELFLNAYRKIILDELSKDAWIEIFPDEQIEKCGLTPVSMKDQKNKA